MLLTHAIYCDDENVCHVVFGEKLIYKAVQTL